MTRALSKTGSTRKPLRYWASPDSSAITASVRTTARTWRRRSQRSSRARVSIWEASSSRPSQCGLSRDSRSYKARRLVFITTELFITNNTCIELRSITTIAECYIQVNSGDGGTQGPGRRSLCFHCLPQIFLGEREREKNIQGHPGGAVSESEDGIVT
jgi:hypothetical protein